jgi:hypothetical protein
MSPDDAKLILKLLEEIDRRRNNDEPIVDLGPAINAAIQILTPPSETTQMDSEVGPSEPRELTDAEHMQDFVEGEGGPIYATGVSGVSGVDRT